MNKALELLGQARWVLTGELVEAQERLDGLEGEELVKAEAAVVNLAAAIYDIEGAATSLEEGGI